MGQNFIALFFPRLSGHSKMNASVSTHPRAAIENFPVHSM